MKQLSAIVLAAMLLLVSTQAAMAGAGAPVSPGHEIRCGCAPCGSCVPPTFVITAVARNNYVEIMTDNFPANENFIVTMNYMGTQGIGGYVVATTNSGSGGRFTARYYIPAALYNQHQIAIRLQSTSSGYYAYNWFYNTNANVSAPSTPPTTCCYYGFPTFSIAAVDKDTSVTIAGNNFPPNDEFIVRMNWMHTRGISGAIVDEAKTDANGYLKDVEYPIPAFLTGSYKIAIRLESPTSGYYAYNWFYNNDAP
jgi:hypothetical protein